jgi:hypothetical protein
MEGAFEWVTTSRAAFRSKEEGKSLSLGYIVDVLEAAGKLEGIDAQKLQRRCGAYDFFKAKEHFFAVRIRSLAGEDANRTVRKFMAWCKDAQTFSTATLLHSLKGGKPISNRYLRSILQSARSDLEGMAALAAEARNGRVCTPDEEDVTTIREGYAKACRSLEKRQKAGKISPDFTKKMLGMKRREVKMALTALEMGVRLEQRAFRKLASA